MTYRIFISHKAEDVDIAVAVGEAIAKFAGQLKCFIAEESITPGEDWRERVRAELQQTDLLLLLFTAPTRNWDWCLYEAGLFTRLREPEDRRVVCIHEGGEPPGPLLDRQAVEAQVPSVAAFLSRLLRTTEITGRDDPLNINATDEDLNAAASVICGKFGAVVEPFYTSYRLELDLPPLPNDQDHFDGIPEEATVVAPASEATLRIFGRTWAASWGDLTAGHRERGEPWLSDLDEAFARTGRGEVAQTITRTFAGNEGTHIFRPELYRMDMRGRTPTAAVIVFTQEVAPAKVGGALFNRLRITERYHHEVFKPLASAEDPSREDLAEIVRTFGLIGEEARIHHVFAEESFRRLFPDPEEQEHLREVRTAWQDAVDRMGVAGEMGDTGDLLGAMADLQALNGRYRARVATHYAQKAQLEVATITPPSVTVDEPGGSGTPNVLKKGDTGDRVKDIQEVLVGLGYPLPTWGADGDFGDETAAAVAAFQSDVRIPADGVWRPQTEDYATGVLQSGDKGAAVAAVQEILRLAGFELPRWGADGDYGDETIAAVEALQREVDITVDGVFGPVTRRAALNKIRGR